MRISEVIRVLRKAQERYGDVPLHVISDDGRSSWLSGYNPVVKYRNGHYYIEHDGY